MTPEQLDEIEKLAALWDRFGMPHDAAAELADHALPLVKALREARERCETLRGLADEKAHDAGLYARRMEQAQKARSEARAEVERLREAARQVHALASVLVVDWDPRRVNQAVHEIHEITKGMVE